MWQMFRNIVIGLLCGAVFSCPSPVSAQEVPSEYEVKAAYIYNFTNYVEWPPAAFQSNSDPIQLCVMGPGNLPAAFSKMPKTTALGRQINPIFYEEVPRPDQIERCHLVFYSSRFEDQLQKLPKTKSLLTISDQSESGMISFVVKDQKVRFKINLSSATEAGFKISSQVLKLALSVKGSQSE